MDNNQLFDLMSKVVLLAEKAGEIILKVYEKEDIGLEYKSDDSPLTLADTLSNEILESGLKKLTPNFPIISEETEPLAFDARSKSEYVWLVDPLDGTKEFVNRNGEFSVNVALVKNGESVLGVLMIPALKQVAYACRDCGAFLEKDGMVCRLDTSTFTMNEHLPKLSVSRSHINAYTKQYIADHYPIHTLIPGGSALKFVQLCNGHADIYPRLGTTMEWDIAAPQIILEEAGGSVLRLDDGLPMRYNKEDLKNPEFIAYSNKAYHG